jgi:hypothetical protein
MAVSTIVIYSAECERGFSQRNLTCTSTHVSLHTSTISGQLFLDLIGPPLTKFNPVPYVRSWIAKGHRCVTDIRSKTRNEEKTHKEMAVLWKVLEN